MARVVPDTSLAVRLRTALAPHSSPCQTAGLPLLAAIMEAAGLPLPAALMEAAGLPLPAALMEAAGLPPAANVDNIAGCHTLERFAALVAAHPRMRYEQRPWTGPPTGGWRRA